MGIKLNEIKASIDLHTSGLGFYVECENIVMPKYAIEKLFNKNKEVILDWV